MHACICMCVGVCIDIHSGKFSPKLLLSFKLTGCSPSFQFTPISYPQCFTHSYNIFLSLVSCHCWFNKLFGKYSVFLPINVR